MKFFFGVDKLLYELISFVLYIEEDDDARDVVDHVLLSLPLLESGPYKVFCGTFSISLQKVRIDDVSDLLVLEELPDAVAGQNDDFVGGAHVVLGDLRYGVDTDTGSNLVTERSAHRESRNVFMFQPDALGTNFMPLAVPVRVYSTTSCNNYL